MTCAVLMLLFSRCATQRPPDGGPPDTDPPSLESTYPVHGTVRFSDTRVRFNWDEYIDRQSFERSVHVSPLPERAVTFDWSGKSVELRFPGPLGPDRTYVITIGTGVKDVRGGNTIRQSIQLAFSTGDSLDTGAFSGIVFDPKPAGVSMFAYLLTGRSPDTLDPTVLRPDFIVQSGEDGRFMFTNLPGGRYRVFAVRDRQGNTLYDRESDDIGIAQSDIGIEARDSIGPSLRFLLSTEDTTAPYVQSVECVNNRQVQIKFSEALSEDPPVPRRISFVDSASAERIRTQSAAPVPGKRHQYAVVPASDLRETKYFLELDSLYDAAGNPVSPHGVMAFPGASTPDTGRPTIVASYPAAKATEIPADSAFRLMFSHPMRSGGSVTVRDSTGIDIPGVVVWRATNAADIHHTQLQGGVPHMLCLDGPTWIDSLGGRSLADSITCIPFTTVTEDIFGEISGTIADTADAGSAAIVRARNTERKDVSASVRTSAGEQYRMPRVPAGKYVLDAFRDSDGNGRYSFGSAFPFRPSEGFGILADTVRVRAKWETKDVSIRIP